MGGQITPNTKYKPKLLHDLLLDSLGKYQRDLVFHKTDRWGSISNTEFLSIVRTIGAFLVQQGLKNGDTVLIAGFSCWQWLATEIAVLQAGGVVVGIDPFADFETFRSTHKQVHARFLITDTPKTAKKWGPSLYSQMKTLFWNGSEKYLYTANPRQDALSTPDFPHINPYDIAVITFTSGSTGNPKGIPFSHEQIVSAISAIITGFSEFGTGEERMISWLPLAHLFQQMLNFCAVVQGCELFFLEDPRDISLALKEIHPTLMVGVPRFFEKAGATIHTTISKSNFLVQYLFKKAMATARRVLDLEKTCKPVPLVLRLKKRVLDIIVLKRIRGEFGGALKLWVSGSAPLSQDDLQLYETLGYPIYEVYGVSENVIPIAMNTITEYRPGSVGKPIPTQQIAFALDGEILVKGPGIARSYLGLDREITAEDGYYHTGDLGYLDDDGYLYIRGRKGDFIKLSNGRKVFPAAIESVLNRSKYIEQSFVCDTGKPGLVALVYPSPDTDTHNQYSRVEEAIGTANAAIQDRHARIRTVYPLDEPFSIGEELTPTLKLKRGYIEDKYRDILYSLSTHEQLVA